MFNLCVIMGHPTFFQMMKIAQYSKCTFYEVNIFCFVLLALLMYICACVPTFL